MSNERNFVAACLLGHALLDEVDDWVDDWADAGGAPGGSQVPLDDYLGFTPAEGKLWAEKPESLRFIVAAHDLRVDVSQIADRQSALANAARSENDADADAVVQWLIDHNRL